MAKERTVVKQVKNAILYSDGCIKLENVRASYPHVGKPGENESDSEDAEGNKKIVLKYGITGLLPKKTHVAAKDLCKSQIVKLMTDNEVKIPAHCWFLKNGDESEKETNHGMFTVATSENRRPTARDSRGRVIDDIEKIEEMFYGGCWVNIMIRPWYFNGTVKNSSKKYPKRICCGIVAVQFVKNDDPFGEGRINDDGVFDAVDDDESFDDDNDDL